MANGGARQSYPKVVQLKHEECCAIAREAEKEKIMSNACTYPPDFAIFANDAGVTQLVE